MTICISETEVGTGEKGHLYFIGTGERNGNGGGGGGANKGTIGEGNRRKRTFIIYTSLVQGNKSEI